MGMSLMATWHKRCNTQQQVSSTGHPMGWSVRPCLMDFPLMPSFCVVYSRLTKLARERDYLGEVAVLYGRSPTNNWISRSRKGLFSVLVPTFQYSHGRRRNNTSIQVRLKMDFFLGVTGRRVVSKVWMM